MAAPRILLAGGGTGGHLYPALNLAAALRRAEADVELLLVGARRGIEARVLPGTGLPYRLLPLQPLWRRRPWRNWRLLASLPAVGAGLRRTFRDFRPDVVVGTGGYASGPAVLWGRLTGRSTALQEQNAEPGLVTRLLAGRVDQLHLGYPEALERLRPGRETEVLTHGNPVALPRSTAGPGAPPPARPGAPPPARPGAPPEADEEGFRWPEGRVLLVTGGSQGARGLNRRLLEDLELVQAAWPEGWSAVWIAGPSHAGEIGAGVERLPWADRIRVVPFVEGLGARLGAVDLAVSRSGAMFVAELAAAGVPAVLVPFPAAAGGHQSANARAMVAAGAAELREEAALAPGELWSLVRRLMTDEARRGTMARAARARGAPDAADRIAADLLRLARASR